MLKFLKMMVAEDVIITEEVLVEVLVVEEVLLQEEKAVSLQDVKVLVVDLEAIEVQLLVKVVLVQESILLQERVVSQTELQDHLKLQDVMVVLLKDQQDVLKTLVMHQEKKDQEEAKERLQNLDCSLS
jgi:hypothetical protein